jgi:predicted outer membrane repeat protein
MHDDDTNPNLAANRAQRRQQSRARRIAAVGSSALLATSAGAFLAAMTAAPAGAATITVSNLNDSGAGSLRNALATANDGDTIDLTGLSGTINLTSGELVIEDAVTIAGPGAGALAIDGGGTGRVFSTDFSITGGAVTVSGLTITHGDAGTGAGGGLYMDCGSARDIGNSLVISGVVFADNTGDDLGGALYFDRCIGGSLTISDSRFTGNTSRQEGGGAIWSDEGTATTITNSTFQGNSAVYSGGAIEMDNGEAFTVTNSTFVENAARGGDGGAILARDFDGVGLVANSTFVSNTATAGNGEGAGPGNGGAISVESAASFTIYQSTITGNTAEGLGDGLYLNTYATPPAAAGARKDPQQGDKAGVHAATIDGPVVITGTIVAGNADGSDDVNGGGDETVTLATNVIGTVAGTLNVVDAGGNQLGVTDPKLAPLSDNGGPTATMALAPGSPALDAGPATEPDFLGNAFDQRGPGFDRVVNGKADVGAYEVQAPAPIDIAPRFTG